MYEQDTFFHLSVWGRTGLAILSFVLAALTLWCFLKISTRFGLAVKVPIAFVLLFAFVWLTPQVYYLYYRFLIDGLPLQIVIGAPPSFREMLEIVTFSGKATLSEHSKGILFWLMIATALVKAPVKSHPRAFRK